MNNREIALLAAKAMDDRKGQDVVVLDVAQRASFADYLVIASGMTDRLVAALCDEVEDRLAKEGVFVKNTEGKGNTGWILMDFGDVIVNVFTEEKRAHYNIERLWGDCPRVEFETTEE